MKLHALPRELFTHLIAIELYVQYMIAVHQYDALVWVYTALYHYFIFAKIFDLRFDTICQLKDQ